MQPEAHEVAQQARHDDDDDDDKLYTRLWSILKKERNKYKKHRYT